jgi:hypothetical protein
MSLRLPKLQASPLYLYLRKSQIRAHLEFAAVGRARSAGSERDERHARPIHLLLRHVVLPVRVFARRRRTCQSWRTLTSERVKYRISLPRERVCALPHLEVAQLAVAGILNSLRAKLLSKSDGCRMQRRSKIVR